MYMHCICANGPTSRYSKVLDLIAHIIEIMVAAGFKLYDIIMSVIKV